MFWPTLPGSPSSGGRTEHSLQDCSNPQAPWGREWLGLPCLTGQGLVSFPCAPAKCTKPALRGGDGHPGPFPGVLRFLCPTLSPGGAGWAGGHGCRPGPAPPCCLGASYPDHEQRGTDSPHPRLLTLLCLGPLICKMGAGRPLLQAVLEEMNPPVQRAENSAERRGRRVLSSRPSCLCQPQSATHGGAHTPSPGPAGPTYLGIRGGVWHKPDPTHFLRYPFLRCASNTCSS